MTKCFKCGETLIEVCPNSLKEAKNKLEAIRTPLLAIRTQLHTLYNIHPYGDMEPHERVHPTKELVGNLLDHAGPAVGQVHQLFGILFNVVQFRFARLDVLPFVHLLLRKPAVMELGVDVPHVFPKRPGNLLRQGPVVE